MEADENGRLDDLERRLAELERRSETDRRHRRAMRWLFLASLLVYVLYLYRVITLLP